MDKISVDTLFPNTKIKNRELNVDNLFPPETRLGDNIEYFDADELINENKKKKLEIHKTYRKMLNQCYDDIKYQNSLEKYDTIFSVPEFIFMIPNYNSKECLEYLEKKLRRHYIDTYIISETEIFVSWFNIEKNKEIEKVIEKYKKNH